MAFAETIINLGRIEKVTTSEFLTKFDLICKNKTLYDTLSRNSYALCDGLGCQRIIKEVIN